MSVNNPFITVYNLTTSLCNPAIQQARHLAKLIIYQMDVLMADSWDTYKSTSQAY